MENFYSAIDPFSILKDVLKRWWIILLLALSASLLTYVAVSYRYVPAYSTSTTFIVTDKEDAADVFSSLESAEKTAGRFIEVLEGSLLKKAVKEDLGMDSFNATTTCHQVPSTNMVQLTVTADSAYDSFMIMKSILKNYGSVSDYIVGNVYLEIIEQPSLAAAPVKKLNVRKPVTRAFLATAAILVLLFAFFSFNRDTVKNYEQFKAKVDAYSCGVVYHERKTNKKHVTRIGYLFFEVWDLFFRPSNKRVRNVSMLIDNPIRSLRYVESNRMVASRVRGRMEKINAQVLLVTSVAENEGKSTMAANIALGIAEEGKRVLLIDADLRKPSQFRIFSLEDEQRVDMVSYLKNDRAEVLPAARYKETNLYLLANAVPIRESYSSVPFENMNKLIDYYSDQMDYIILDSAPMGIISDTETIAALADRSLLVVREDTVLAQHINDTVDLLAHSGTEVIGAIFSDATRKKMSEHRGNYGGYGGYYGERN